MQRPLQTPLQTTTPVITTLEACRGLAAMLVLCYHATAIFALPKYFAATPFDRFFAFGYSGVDFFFVLSGFIIIYVHHQDTGKAHRLLPFLYRRFIRIYPVYWLITCLMIPVFFLHPSFGHGYEREPAYLFKSLLLIPSKESPLIIVAWSLRYEVVFYLLFGLSFLNKTAGMASVILWQALVVLANIFIATGITPHNPNNPAEVPFMLNIRNVEFLLGGASALIVLYARPRNGLLYATAGAALFIATGLEDVYGPSFNLEFGYLLYGLSAFVFVTGIASAELNGRVRVHSRLVLTLGGASYVTYLLHFPLLSLLAKGTLALHLNRLFSANVLFVAICAAIVCLCALFHLLVEKPLLRSLRSLYPTDPHH